MIAFIHRTHNCYKFPDRLDLGTAMTMFNSTTSFYFVRHPLVRFVSSFQDRILDDDIWAGWMKKAGLTPQIYKTMPWEQVRKHAVPLFK